MTIKIEGKLASLQRPFFPKSFDQNFEIAILFSIVKRSNNYTFVDNMLPNSSWVEGYKLQNLFIVYAYSVCYWEVNSNFWRGVDFLLRGIFHNDNFPSGGKFPRVSFLEKYLKGGIYQNSKTKFFLFVLLCLCWLNLTCINVLGKIFSGVVTVCKNFPWERGIFLGRNSPREIPCRSNFPLGVGDFRETFIMEERFPT